MKVKMTSEKPAITKTLVFSITAAAVGSAFQHGYNLGVTNNSQHVIENFINESYFNRFDEPASQTTITIIFSVFVSIYCIGGMIGGLMTAFMADKFGSKKGLIFNNVFVVIATICMGVSKAAECYELLIIGRLFVGINAGLSGGLAPMYLSEISPVCYRGAVGTIYQLVLTVAISVSQVLGLTYTLGTSELWPFLFGLIIVPALVMLISLPFCPDSPKFLLIVKDEHTKAERALQRLRGTKDVHFEMEEIRNEAEAAKLVPKMTLKEMLRNPCLRAPLIISVMIMLSQQLSGINAAIFFSTDIFKSAGLEGESPLWATMGVGLINVVITIISLVLIEKAGRRTLHLSGLGGMAACTVILTVTMEFKDSAAWVSYITVIGLTGFVIMFAIGPGSIPWFLVTELFSQGARPIASSLAVGINWSANFLVGLAFLPLTEVIHHYTFLIFTAILVGFWVYSYKMMPETKNKTIEEITARFRVASYENGKNGVIHMDRLRTIAPNGISNGKKASFSSVDV